MHKDEQTRRRAERMLQFEAERMRQMAQYRAELQSIEDSIDHEQRELRYAREGQDKRRAIQAKKEELEALRNAKERRHEMERLKQEMKQANKLADSSRDESGPSSSTANEAAADGTTREDATDVPTSAAAEWEHMK